jgi:hypothetical protein
MKRSTGFALAVFVLALGLCGAAPAFADVTGVKSDGNSLSSAPPVTWDQDTVALTNYSGSQLTVSANSPTFLTLFGDYYNSVEAANYNFPDALVYESAGSFTIQGTGSLKVKGVDVYNSFGIKTNGNLIISGDVRVAIANANDSNDHGISVGGSFTVNTNGEVRIEPTGTIQVNHQKGVLFIGKEGQAEGSFNLMKTVTVAKGETLEIAAGANVTVPSAVHIAVDDGGKLTIRGKLANNGTLTNNGVIDIKDSGGLTTTTTVQGNGTIYGNNFTGDPGDNKLNPGGGGVGGSSGGCATGAPGLAGLASLALMARSKRRGR